MDSARQVVEQLRDPAAAQVVSRTDRGDVRSAVLVVLAGQPMNGYQIVRALEAQSGGTASPTAGSVYPTLQLLADEGLATATETDGRKTWDLTAAGRVAAEAAQHRAAASEVPGGRAPARRGALPRSGAQLAQAVALAAQTGTPDQIADAVAVLDEARRKLLSILARD